MRVEWESDAVDVVVVVVILVVFSPFSQRDDVGAKRGVRTRAFHRTRNWNPRSRNVGWRRHLRRGVGALIVAIVVDSGTVRIAIWIADLLGCAS